MYILSVRVCVCVCYVCVCLGMGTEELVRMSFPVRFDEFSTYISLGEFRVFAFRFCAHPTVPRTKKRSKVTNVRIADSRNVRNDETSIRTKGTKSNNPELMTRITVSREEARWKKKKTNVC